MNKKKQTLAKIIVIVLIAAMIVTYSISVIWYLLSRFRVEQAVASTMWMRKVRAPQGRMPDNVRRR